MPNQGFLRGALILAFAGATSRMLGVFYVTVLPRVLQGEGYGLYTAVKPIYHALLILAVAGLPVAIAKMVADRLAVGDVREVRHIFTVSLLAMLVTGSLATVLLVVVATPVATSLLGLPKTALLLQAVAPAIILLALASALRGYFQGLQRMSPIALSQIAEQLSRVVATVGFTLLFAPRGQAEGAAGAMLGGVAGGLCALLVLVGCYMRQRRSIAVQLAQRARFRPPRKKHGTLRNLAALAFPLVLGQILWPLFEFLDTLLVPARLQTSGYSLSAAMTALGYLGMAGQLMWFPNVMTLALSASLVPAVAEAWAVGQMRQVQRRISESLRVAWIFGLPAAVGLFLLADECAWLLFGYPQAGQTLAVLSFGTVAIGIQQVTAGALQGLGKVGLPVRNLLSGACVKLVLNWWLVGESHLGVLGAALATVIGFAVAALLNYVSVRRLTGLQCDWEGWLTKPILGTTIMSILVRLTSAGLLLIQEQAATRWSWPLTPFVVNATTTLGAIAVGLIGYIAVMLRIGGVRQRDIDALPYFGPRWSALLIRKGWVA